MFKYLILDLDETLYPRSSGLMTAVVQRIILYLIMRVGISPGEAEMLRQRFYVQYGTALRGLQLEYDVDADDYLGFVHDVPLENYIAPDPALDAMLGRIPLDKVIFTNADAAHARRVMERLGVAHHFSSVIDIHALGFNCKPSPVAYRRLLEILDVPGTACVLVDDTARNLHPAREQFGMTTVLVDGQQTDGVDYCIGSLLELEELVNRLIAGIHQRMGGE